MRLQEINGAIAVNRSRPREDTHKICFYIFDAVPTIDGGPNVKFSNRFLDIYHGLARSDLLSQIIPVPTALASSWNEVEQHFHLYTANGYEGIMLRPDGPYEFGEHLGRNGTMTQYRSKFLWKHKHWEDDEYECIDTTAGEGKAEIGIGALVLKTNSNVTFKVGTGFTDRDRIDFASTPPIGKWVKVRYLCLTADGVPFNPSFIAVV
jgi:DNA ligase-1